jgi:hypothetical protein
MFATFYDNHKIIKNIKLCRVHETAVPFIINQFLEQSKILQFMNSQSIKYRTSFLHVTSSCFDTDRVLILGGLVLEPLIRR